MFILSYCLFTFEKKWFNFEKKCLAVKVVKITEGSNCKNHNSIFSCLPHTDKTEAGSASCW